MSERPSDRAQPKQKRRPGEQLTKDNFEDSDNDEPAEDPGTWGKADAATMARRKVIKVRRGAGGDGAAAAPSAAADQPEAAGASNPFAGVSLTPAPAAASNPCAGVSLTAPAAAQQVAAENAGGDQPSAAATAADGADKPADAAPAEVPKAAEDVQQPASTAPAAAGEQQEQQEGSKPEESRTAAGTTAEQQAEGKTEDKPAAASTSGGLGGFGGFASSTTGGFGGFSSSTGGFGGFGGAGGFGGLVASAGKDGEGSKSLFGSFQAPPPGSGFSGFGSAGGSKAKDVEEGGGGGEGEEGGEENGQQELFGGPEVAPVVQLSEVPKQTGEEDENSVFTAEGKLYEFVDGKDWKERGRGELRLNVNHSTHRARLVMRQKGSQRLLLNANLYPKMTTSKMVGGKGATFAAVNAAPPVPGGEGGAVAKEEDGEGAASAAAAAAAAASMMKTYAFKAKSADEISTFLAAVDRYKVERPDVAGSGDTATGAGAAKNPDAW